MLWGEFSSKLSVHVLRMYVLVSVWNCEWIIMFQSEEDRQLKEELNVMVDRLKVSGTESTTVQPLSKQPCFWKAT